MKMFVAVVLIFVILAISIAFLREYLCLTVNQREYISQIITNSNSTRNHSINSTNITDHHYHRKNNPFNPKDLSRVSKYSRRITFNNWPERVPVDVSDLVDAGFFYTGILDNVQCFYCGGILVDWKRGDIPLNEHVRLFPSCTFAQVMKNTSPDTTVPLSQSSSSLTTPPSPPSAPSPSRLFPVVPPPPPPPPLLCLPTFPSTTSPLPIISPSSSARPFHRHLSTLPPSLSPPLCFLSSPSSSSTFYLLPSMFSSLNLQMEECNEEKYHHYQQQQQQQKPEQRPQEEAQQQKTNHLFKGQELMCKICMDKEVEIVFIPCGHFVSCTQCALYLSNCAVCRRPIKEFMRSFLS